MLATTLLPCLVYVAELPLLMKVRRELLCTLWRCLLELLTIMRGVRKCSKSFCRQKAFGCSDGPRSGEMSGEEYCRAAVEHLENLYEQFSVRCVCLQSHSRFLGEEKSAAFHVDKNTS